MKRTLLPLLLCIGHLLIATPVMGQHTSRQTTPSSTVDALWISILPFQGNVTSQASYFDLQSDGRFVFGAGDPGRLTILRSGIISKMLVRRAFQIVGKPSVMNARDTDPGEPIFSDSDWVSIGFMAGGKVKARGGWAYQEEMKDFPAEFQQLIKELRSVAAKLPPATNIKALLSAALVDPRRIELIGRDRFLSLDQAELDKFPPLKEAIFMSRRMVAVDDETQMSRLAELARRMQPKAKYWGLYKIGEQSFYEIGSYYSQ